MKHLMIDIETLGKAPNGAIVQIAAVEFDPMTGKAGREFSQNISATDSQRRGMDLDADTVLWWMKQSPEAQKMVFSDGDVFSLVMDDFFQFVVKAGSDVVVWANGAQFDLVILKQAFLILRSETPWEWRNERDARTIYKLFPEVKGDVGFIGEKHNAIDDCKNQIRWLHACYERIFNV